MSSLDKVFVRRVLEALSAVTFGLLAAASSPDAISVLFVAAAAVAVGIWSRGVRVGLAGLVVLVAASVARAVWVDGHSAFLVDELPSAVLRAALPWVSAVAVRQYISLGRRADHERELRRRARLAELERRSAADRLALARTLHDGLGHTLSLVALTLARLELDPAVPRTSQLTISRAREELAGAVEQLGGSVVDLREGSTPRTPPPDPARVLIRKARDAGASLTVHGLPEDSRLDGFANHLLVQLLRETLTNATKHAPRQAISIDAVETGSGLQVRIANPDPHPGSGPRSAGSGLADLARDFTAEGGALEFSSTDEHFVVSALVPKARGAALPHPGEDDVLGDRDRASTSDRMKRAQWRLVIAASAVVILGLVAGEAASVAQKRRALLSAESFAQITTGDTRDGVAALLPEHELPLRRGDADQPGCHLYAVTARPFDRAAGDVYRICFDGDVVTNADYVTGTQR